MSAPTSATTSTRGEVTAPLAAAVVMKTSSTGAGAPAVAPDEPPRRGEGAAGGGRGDEDELHRRGRHRAARRVHPDRVAKHRRVERREGLAALLVEAPEVRLHRGGRRLRGRQ